MPCYASNKPYIKLSKKLSILTAALLKISLMKSQKDNRGSILEAATDKEWKANKIHINNFRRWLCKRKKKKVVVVFFYSSH